VRISANDNGRPTAGERSAFVIGFALGCAVTLALGIALQVIRF
jgi:hypothetical protein